VVGLGAQTAGAVPTEQTDKAFWIFPFGLLQASSMEIMMTRVIFAFSVFFLSALATPASAKGCLKGAVVGGVVGHYARHHGVIGAAVGCLIGRHRAKKNARAEPNVRQYDAVGRRY